MVYQTTTLCECFCAKCAWIWLFSRVGELVDLQTASLCERFTAVLTTVRFRTRVDSEVNIQGTLGMPLLVTDRTYKWLLVGGMSCFAQCKWRLCRFIYCFLVFRDFMRR